MPFYLKATDIVDQVDGLRSVLIVPCGFCPAVSLAVRKKKPYIELFRRFMKTEVYETFIKALQRCLEEKGIRASVFKIKMPQHYVTCMWPSGRKRDLEKRARRFDAVVVLGCEAAVTSVKHHILSDDIPVIQGMDIEGIMTVHPTVRFPFNVSLSMQSVTAVKEKMSASSSETAVHSGLAMADAGVGGRLRLING